jgi:hypothetical protein
MASQVNYPSYFEFMVEFVKFYAVVLGPYILQILSTLINRIMTEHQAKTSGDSTKQNVLISKCWNIIRTVVFRHEYQGHQAQIEEILKPLYVFMVDPTKISFEDDIVMCVKAVIRKTKAVSQTQWDILSQLPKVLAKNKDSLGNILEATNHFLQYG